jgi:hypothetical protein
MIIKCPECGIEYSYGRNICHVCDNNIILFGSIFFPSQKFRNWNCLEKSCNDSDTIKEIGKSEIKSEETDNKEVIMQEISRYKWNCFKSVEFTTEVDRKVNLVYIYE